MPLIDKDALKHRIGEYYTGKSDALLDKTILQRVRMRRRQLGQMTMALDRDLARKRIPSGDYHISRKVDGEYTCLVYNEGEVFTINPGGTVRMGADFHGEAKEALAKTGVKFAILGGELYVRREDGKRPRVHDVVRVARAPKSEAEVASLGFAVFNIYQWDEEQRGARYGERYDRIVKIFTDTERVHPVETVIGDGSKAVLKQFKKWVDGEDAEGVVARSDTAGVFKVKPRLEGHVCESEYAEVNSDRVAYRMIKPGIVFEISCLDMIARTSRGNTVDRMVLEYNEDGNIWQGIRRLPLCSIISPQFVRIREDKSANKEDIAFSQLTDIVDIPSANVVSEELKLPQSELLKRAVATKNLRGATGVRKLMLWKTNKEETRDYPAYVLHLTDYSPNRKDPLKHEVRVSSCSDQMEQYWKEWEKKYFVSGWSAPE